MDKKRPQVLIVVAVVVGLLAALSVLTLLPSGGANRKTPVGQEVNQIFVTKKDIPIGTRLTEDTIGTYLQKKSWPKDYLPKDSISDKKDLLDRTVKTTILADTPLLKPWLSETGAAGVMPLIVQPGMRAFTVTVDEASGVGGFVVPGAFVDVIATFRNVRTPSMGQRAPAETVTKTILQDVRVLAVGQSMEPKEGQPKLANSVTLEVSPEHVEALALASREGQIALALRKIGDVQTAENLPGATLEELLGVSPITETEPKVVTQAPKVETKPAGPVIELIKGSEITMVPVERH